MRTAVLAALSLCCFASPVRAQALDSGGFLIRIAADTFAVESFQRTADRLEGSVEGRAIGRLSYVLAMGGSEAGAVLTLHAWPPGSDATAAPAQEARMTVLGDSVVAELTSAAGTQTQRFGTRPGAIPYLNPSFGIVEEIVRRARGVGGSRVEVPIFMVQGGQTFSAVVAENGPDSVIVSLAGAEIRAGVDNQSRLTGGAIPAQNLTFVRTAGPPPAPRAATPPDYSAPDGAPYTAEEVVVTTPGGHLLAGTLTRPAGRGRVPAVVTITGSGPQDRDQALPPLPGYRPFREIADTLGRRGIAVLRLDDRGTGASTGDFAAATSEHFAEDVRAALHFLRQRDDIDHSRLGLVGHSEGGLIAPLVAATDTALRVIVVIAGPSRTGREIIAYQQRQAIEAMATVPPESRDSALADLRDRTEQLAGGNPWLRFFLDFDPLPAARQVRRASVLVLHGETDRQVDPGQAEELAAEFREGGNPDVTVRTFADVNHLLLHDPVGDPARYPTLADRSVHRELLGVLADWTAERLLD